LRRAVQGVIVAAVVATAAAAAPVCAAAQSASAAARVIDVPYLSQTTRTTATRANEGDPGNDDRDALCGGAAAAMVMRFWGARDAYPEAFASLVDRRAGGIRAATLVSALGQRGWDARAFRGDPALVQSQLRRGRPLVALIDSGARPLHFVVVVGWAAGRVVVHDPARGPFQVIAERDFLRDWERSDFWTMLVVPRRLERLVDGNDADLDPLAVGPCGETVREAVRLASTGQADRAGVLLDQAVRACPDDPAPWRERAGLHALKQQWGRAAADARAALARDAYDAHAARILATSLFLQDDPDGALQAWNSLGEPSVDIVNIRGLEHTRFAAAERALGIEPRTLLTRGELARARRRLSELPAAMATRVFYTPGEDGHASVDAVVIERPHAPLTPVALAAMGLRAATDRELIASWASPSGAGELVSFGWRWWEARPRVSLRFSAPAPEWGAGSVWSIEAQAEHQTYAEERGLIVESRRGVSFTASDWLRGGWRWEFGAGFDRFSANGVAASGRVGVAWSRFDNRLVCSGDLVGLAGEFRSAVAHAGLEWRSNVRNERFVWLARTGVDEADGSAPLALWPGAGTGQGRDALLRAHPLLHDGAIDGTFGRRLVYSGVEARRWIQLSGKPVRFAPAAFVDVARAARGLAGSDTRAHVDAGAGLRVAVPGAGVLRMDVARGLRDGAFAFSAGWTR
jgi:peptidase C39-like protein